MGPTVSCLVCVFLGDNNKVESFIHVIVLNVYTGVNLYTLSKK